MSFLTQLFQNPHKKPKITLEYEGTAMPGARPPWARVRGRGPDIVSQLLGFTLYK